MPTTSAVNQGNPERKNFDNGRTEVVGNSEASAAPRASTQTMNGCNFLSVCHIPTSHRSSRVRTRIFAVKHKESAMTMLSRYN